MQSNTSNQLISGIASRYVPNAMSFNHSTFINGGVFIITKTIIGDSIEVIDDPKINKGTDIIDIKIVQVVFCILYTVIFVLGIFGNVLVCYVVFRNKAMQTVTNLFITNLALSDILLCIFAIPLTPMYTFLGRWIFGRILCHLMPYVQGTSVYISTLTLTSIAIDRFFVIMYPFDPRMKLNTCIFIIVFIWFFSLVVTCPYGLFMAIQITNNKTYYCEESWPSDKSRKIFGVFTTVLQFLVPFLIITVCYVCVSMRLNNRAKIKICVKNTKREEADRDRKKRTNRMLISMVAIFGISWLPLNLINIFNDFYAQMTEWNYYYISFFLAHSMAMASTCYNAFLYTWLNENFRKEFKQVLPFSGFMNRIQNTSHPERTHTHKTSNKCNGNEMINENLLPTTYNRVSSTKETILEEIEQKHNNLEIHEITLEEKNVSTSLKPKNKIKNTRTLYDEFQLSELPKKVTSSTQSSLLTEKEEVTSFHQ